jgi:purine catabolism regulator
MTDSNERITVEDVRKQALPLGTRVVAGDSMLGQQVSWTTVIYPEDGTTSKTLQRGEMILVAPQAQNSKPVTTDVDVVRWASDMHAAAVVLSDSPSPAAMAEANAYNMPVLTLPAGSRIRLVEKAIVSLLVDRKGQLQRDGPPDQQVGGRTGQTPAHSVQFGAAAVRRLLGRNRTIPAQTG